MNLHSGMERRRLERELGEERSINAKLSSELVHTKQRLGELAESHQRLKFQARRFKGFEYSAGYLHDGGTDY